MSIEKIIEYVMSTPDNTNPAILRGMLERLVSEGSDESAPVVGTAKVGSATI